MSGAVRVAPLRRQLVPFVVAIVFGAFLRGGRVVCLVVQALIRRHPENPLARRVLAWGRTRRQPPERR